MESIKIGKYEYTLEAPALDKVLKREHKAYKELCEEYTGAVRFNLLKREWGVEISQRLVVAFEYHGGAHNSYDDFWTMQEVLKNHKAPMIDRERIIEGEKKEYVLVLIEDDPYNRPLPITLFYKPETHTLLNVLVVEDKGAFDDNDQMLKLLGEKANVHYKESTTGFSLSVEDISTLTPFELQKVEKILLKLRAKTTVKGNDAPSTCQHCEQYLGNRKTRMCKQCGLGFHKTCFKEYYKIQDIQDYHGDDHDCPRCKKDHGWIAGRGTAQREYKGKINKTFSSSSDSN